MRELRKEQFGGSNYAEYENGELVKRHQLNKSELRQLRSEMEKPAPVATTKTIEGRYVDLASRTTGENTGRAWVADLSTVERHSIPPEWEGELVCYVYPK